MSKCFRAGWRLAILAWVGIWASSLRAQDVPPPRAPFVASLPDSAKWTLTFTAPPGKKAIDPAKQQLGDAYIQRVEAEKHGNVRREILSWSNGKTTQGWTVGEYYASDLEESDQVNVQSAALNSAEHGTKTDFPLVTWIGQKNYQGVATLNGQKCYLYRDDLPLGQGMGGHFYHLLMSSSKMAAYISVDTGLPVLVEIAGVKATFAFAPAPTDTLVVPDKYLQAIARVDDTLKAMRRRPGSP